MAKAKVQKTSTFVQVGGPAAQTIEDGFMTLFELRKKRSKLINVNNAYRSQLTQLDKLAVWVTGHVGTMGFFLIIFGWTVSWLTWNTLAPAALRFDPYPAFVLWLFISNMIQICLMPLIMVGQNLQGRHAEKLAESDFAVNKRAEREVDAILARLEVQDKVLDMIYKAVSKKKTGK